MSKQVSLSIIVVLLFLFPLSLYAQVGDTAWPMFRQNLKHTGLSAYNGPEDFKLLWKFPTNDVVESSPSIDYNGNIIVGSNNGNLYSIKPKGTQNWRFETEGSIQSSPAIDEDGTIYFGSGDNNFYALNSDGTLKWKYFADVYIYSSPAIASDGTIYFVASNYLFALNSDGYLRWRKELKFSEFLMEAPSPAIDNDGVIYVSRNCYTPDNGILYAIYPDSTTKWEFQTTDRFDTSPVIGDDGTIFAGTYSGNYIYAINSNGTEKWKFNTGSKVWSSPAIDNKGNLFVGCESGYIYAIDSNYGNMLWRFQTGSAVNSSPIIGANGIIYAGSGDHYFYAINANGNELWKYQTGGPVDSSAALSEDGTIFFGSDDGYLHAIGGAYQVLFDLQKVPVKQYYDFGDSLQIFMDFQKSSHAMYVDVYFALLDSSLEKLMFAPTWNEKIAPIIKNLYLPENLPPIDDAMIIEVNFPSDSPPINKAGDYTFFIVATEPNTFNLLSGVAFVSFSVQ